MVLIYYDFDCPTNKPHRTLCKCVHRQLYFIGSTINSNKTFSHQNCKPIFTTFIYSSSGSPAIRGECLCHHTFWQYKLFLSSHFLAIELFLSSHILAIEIFLSSHILAIELFLSSHILAI